jgi:hypothetical protein
MSRTFPMKGKPFGPGGRGAEALFHRGSFWKTHRAAKRRKKHADMIQLNAMTGDEDKRKKIEDVGHRNLSLGAFKQRGCARIGSIPIWFTG